MTEQDVKSWEKAVKRLIPEGSFGRSGTSNANDWAKFMLKMSERTEDGRSKLEELHDLVGDRSISTVDVRRQFQGMINNPGIGNKVFSFLMLMTGRDDVVILDRIQLNSMRMRVVTASLFTMTLQMSSTKVTVLLDMKLLKSLSTSALKSFTGDWVEKTKAQ